MEETRPHAGTIVRFGVFEVDLHAGELRRKGSKMKLQEQPFQLLAMLLEHPGEVVTREEIHRKLWPSDTFVDFEHSINAAIKRLREALGDSADNPRYVETLTRRGYRFIAPVEGAVAPVSPPAGSVGAGLAPPAGAQQAALLRRWWPALAAVAFVAIAAVVALNIAGLRDRLLTFAGARHGVPLPKIESLAVLPLANLSGDPEQEYFADGMTDELITSLGKIGALRVISRTTVMHFKGAKKTLPEIARELNVDAVIEGSVLRSGDRVRISAQLIHAATDQHLWAETYDRDLRDILALQSDVARAIAGEIKSKLTPAEQARLAKVRPVNPEAYELYLRGRYFWNKRAEETVKKSLDYFEQAIRRDPGSALAYAGLADSYIILGSYEYLPPKEAYPKAKAAAQRALEIDRTLAEAHASLGRFGIEYDWDWSASEEEYKRAIELNPNYATAHHWYADYLAWVGRHNESLVEIERARQLDPLSLIINTVVAISLSYARRYDEAIEQFHRTLEIDSNFAVAHLYLADAYAQTSHFPEAIAEAQKAVSLSGAAPVFVADLARVYAVAGNRAAANRLLKDVLRRSYVPKYHVAMVHIALGKHQEALDWLDKAAEDRSPQLVLLKVDPGLDPLRSDPRFQDLLRRMNFAE
jgi:TolB-like protein/DNA-binding winged helix-turn-helix (wHTH) protein/Tfp pilus assembly protein PilF